MGAASIRSVLPIAMALALSATCMSCDGGQETAAGCPEPTCIDMLADCEFWAARTSRDEIVHYVKLFSCSLSFGTCAGWAGASCSDACTITYMPFACEGGCLTASSTATQ